MIEQVVDYGILEESIRKTILEWNLEDVNGKKEENFLFLLIPL